MKRGVPDRLGGARGLLVIVEVFGVLAVAATIGRAQASPATNEVPTPSSSEPLARVAGPTSGAASMLSGRTLGVDEVMVTAALGWPGLWTEVAFAPSSELNVHVRASVLYGSPVMGLVTGAGGELACPVRLHVFGEGIVDFALRLTPRLALGEGALFGEREGLAAALAFAALFDAHAVFGVRVDSIVTLVAGAGGGAGGSLVDGSSMGLAWVARFAAELGVEALVSRDTMLFAHVEGGWGLAPERAGLLFYPARERLAVALGMGYLL